MFNFSHLTEVKLTYAQHFRIAMTMSYLSGLACGKLFLHAIYPNIYPEDGSALITHLYLEYVKPKMPQEPPKKEPLYRNIFLKLW